MIIDCISDLHGNYPGLHELCEEYFHHKTIEGRPLPEDFHFQVLDFMNNYHEREVEIEPQRFQSSPIRDAYWMTSDKHPL